MFWSVKGIDQWKSQRFFDRIFGRNFKPKFLQNWIELLIKSQIKMLTTEAGVPSFSTE